MCAFFNFRGGFCNFPIAISPRPSNETYETRYSFAKQRRRSIAQIFSQQHIERSTLSFLKENINVPSHISPSSDEDAKKLFFLSVAEMTRRKTGKKSIFQFFLFSNFSPPFVVLEKLHHHAQRPSQKNAGTTQKTLCLEKERVRVREKTRNVSRSRAGVAFFSSFVVKRVRVENSFFLFERSDRWSLVWPSPSWVGFKWQNVKAQSQEFFSLEFCTSFCVFGGLPFLEGRVHFILIRF